MLTFAAIFLLMGLLFGRGACKAAGRRGPAYAPGTQFVDLQPVRAPDSEHVAGSSFVIHAEVADTDERRKQGLGGRPGLEPGYGMLYVYDQPRKVEFTGIGTPFPVSVAFVQEDGTIAGIRKTAARDPAVFTPAEPVKYALEVRVGWFEDRGLGTGDRLVIPPDLTGQPPKPKEQAVPVVPADTPEAEQQ